MIFSTSFRIPIYRLPGPHSMHACIWAAMKIVHVYVVRSASLQCLIYRLRSKTPTGRIALSLSLKERKKTMLLKNCMSRCPLTAVRVTMKKFGTEMQYFSRSTMDTPGADVTVWRGNLRYAVSRKRQSSYLHSWGEKTDINSACGTVVHSITVECACAQPTFRHISRLLVACL
jgi:hypothetical protein